MFEARGFYSPLCDSEYAPPKCLPPAHSSSAAWEACKNVDTSVLVLFVIHKWHQTKANPLSSMFPSSSLLLNAIYYEMNLLGLKGWLQRISRIYVPGPVSRLLRHLEMIWWWIAHLIWDGRFCDSHWDGIVSTFHCFDCEAENWLLCNKASPAQNPHSGLNIKTYRAKNIMTATKLRLPFNMQLRLLRQQRSLLTMHDCSQRILARKRALILEDWLYWCLGCHPTARIELVRNSFYV